MMKKYQWILFDADETLFHFDAFHGLQATFSHFNMVFTEQDYHAYEAINQPLWVGYQNGTVTAQELQYKRFEPWANKLQIPPLELNNLFLKMMAEICFPLDGVIELLNALKGKTKLGIITNGFTLMQQARLKHHGLNQHFNILIVSEEVGVAKPHPDIFKHAIVQMGNPAPHDILMVGDTLESDMLGAINAGMDTCWLNHKKKIAPEHIQPRYQIASFQELEKLLALSIS